MYAKVNPSGCAERHGLVQVRLDLFLEAGDARYNDSRFYVVDETSRKYLKGYTGKVNPDGSPVDEGAYATWEASLPRVWQKERCFHHHIIYLDPYTLKDEQITAAMALHLPNFYKAWTEEWDKVAGGMRHGWDVACRRPRPTRYNVMQPELYVARKAECFTKLDVFQTATFATKVTREGEIFPSTDIDVGSAASNRGTYRAPRDAAGTNRTDIDGNNAANASGTIDTVESYWAFAEAGNEAKVGTFSKSGTTFTCRDAQSIGAMTAGSKQTDTGLDIDIETGDFIGVDARTAKYIYIEADSTGGTAAWETTGQYCDPSDSATFGELTYFILSLYGTGETGGWGNIAKVGGITATDLAKIDGVAVADIAKVNGVAV